MRKLTRSKTDIDERDNRTPERPTTRTKRGFSFDRLTNIGKKKPPPRRQLSISAPISSPDLATSYPAELVDLGSVSPTSPTYPLQSPGLESTLPTCLASLPRLSLCNSANNRIPLKEPPSLSRSGTNSWGRSSGAGTPLATITEGPFELESQLRKASELLKAIRYGGIRLQSSEFKKRDLLPRGAHPMEPINLGVPQHAGTKARAIQQAKDMQKLVLDRAKRSGDEVPPYDFQELIGKGSYGRVFKGKSRVSGGLVALKIIDIDKVDYEEYTTKNLQETLKEISILQQLRDSKARPYVNIIEEARTVHNELWIVSEYASGGSVHTLMKPTMTFPDPGLDEKYIIPIARELALGLKFIHEAGVLHRDLKCNNILILEEGRVQLCDFGVSGTLEPAASKRSTIVGTPYWMAPELQKEWVKDADPNSRLQPNEILYGSEVDIWAYGCTLYEMATGFPPNHKTIQWQLPETGVPELEGDRFSDGLKNLIDYVLQPNPQNRPTADQVLEHPLLADTSKMYPTVTLVQLVERYYRWEQSGGARVSLFNPYGAQAPDPLAPEPEDDEDDWTFSTTDEFEAQFAIEFSDPFSGSHQGSLANPPPADDDRFAKLQAAFREEQIDRGKKGLNALFDMESKPYRYSGIGIGADRPPSDLILRDFNPGAPNRETVIDLDFAAPTVGDVPSIDLGEVPTLKANRMNRMLREFELEDEERDSFDQQQLTRRATRDWKFPSMAAPADKPNRRTVEWTFDAAMAEADYEPVPKESRLSRRRATKDWTFPTMTAPPPDDNRKTRDFVFPPRDPTDDITFLDSGPNFSSSPTLGPGFRPSLRHAQTEPLGSFSDDFPQIIASTPDSPLRTSMIDLDMATIDDYRPTTADSTSASTYTAGTDAMNGNPFDLEDQVHLSQNNSRSSYHMKSQSEPNHAIAGLITPQASDEQGYDANQLLQHPPMHARGVSSVSQMQANKAPPNDVGYPARAQRSLQQPWEGWNHHAVYSGVDESPPNSVSTTMSAEDEDSVDELWDSVEKQQRIAQQQRRRPGYLRSRTRNTSQDEELTLNRSSDTDEAYDEFPAANTQRRTSRVSVGPNGKPLLEFPIPRGPNPEALLGVQANRDMLEKALWKSTTEMRDGLRASRDLLKAMRLSDVNVVTAERIAEETDDQGTVRI